MKLYKIPCPEMIIFDYGHTLLYELDIIKDWCEMIKILDKL